MYEVEVKVRADHASVRSHLADLDAESLGIVEQVDTYYDAPHRDFGETDEALRIRRETPTGDPDAETSALTYKGPLIEAESKTREEHETDVTDPDATAAILDALDFEPAVRVEKTRERFPVRGLTVSLDSVTDLGDFVEVEREVETAADVDPARESAFELLRDLGLDPDAQIRTSYLGLLLEQRRDSE